MLFYYQIHKYKNGHQLVAATVQLDRIDQDTIDRLSDISGQLRPGELFDPYFTCYAVPSEKHFVIARTWQDLTAPRAGCVLTKSIILAMEDWENSQHVYAIFNALRTSYFDLNFPNIELQERLNITEPISEAPIEELVEALFFEQRKPILVFDCNDVEQIIIRLYIAFWPSIRRQFATCSFALAPRSVSNRPFDLLFLTSNMRSRFSDWVGRRIEGARTSRKVARHRWTKDLTDHIFRNAEPSLYDKSTASLFDSALISDESTLRLNLLWNELMAKAKFESSPIAILGLLDIINSQPIFAEALYKSLEPYIIRAINDALDTLTPSEAWKFYAGLLVKHKRKLMGREMLLKVKSACTSLTLTEPAKAINFISSFNPSLEKIPSILYASIGNGLAEHITSNSFSLESYLSLDRKISSTLGLHLLAASRDFSTVLMRLIGNGNKQLNNDIEGYLGNKDKKSIQRAINNLLPHIKTPAHKQITSVLLDKATPRLFLHMLFVIAENTFFNFREFDDILLKSTIKFKAFNNLLELLITYNLQGKGDGLLIKLLQRKPELIKEYFSDPRISFVYKNNVICETVNSLPYQSLSLLAKDSSTSRELLPILVGSKKCSKEKLAEFILIVDLPLDEVLNYLCKLPAGVINSANSAHLVNLIKKSFDKGELSNSLINILNKINQTQADYLIENLLDSRKSTENIQTIFETLLNAGVPVKKSLAEHIDIVSEILASHLNNNIEVELVDSWVSIFGLSKDKNRQRKAAFQMLGYAFNRKISDPTALISTAFPIVYDTFLQGRTFAQSVAYWVFSDWDKCKTLRHDLVNRYLNSDWPPLGMFQVAKKTGILNDVISILSSSRQGKKYMAMAFDEIDKTSLVLDKSIIKQLKNHIKEK